jgi:hypothetical protein
MGLSGTPTQTIFANKQTQNPQNSDHKKKTKQTNKHIKQTITTISLPQTTQVKKMDKQTTHKIIYYDYFITMTQVYKKNGQTKQYIK